MSRAPAVVAIGGGHGLAASLSALRHYAGEITAVVSVADDGGSSGRLRELLAIPAPGDLRRCLGALLPAPSPLGDALEHRFSEGELTGHAFGNLLLAALAASCGDFVAGVKEATRLLGCVGTVLPATSEAVTLKARVDDEELTGQVAIMASRNIREVALCPPDAAPPRAVLEAIARADQVVLGPGSLYTSVLAALAARAIPQAIAASGAQVVYVANLREQVPETAGHDVAAHVAALGRHGVVPDVVVADLAAIEAGALEAGVALWSGSLAKDGGAAHDPLLLAKALQAVAGSGP